MNQRARFGVADGIFLVGGAALVLSAFLPWVARGPGSGLRGHDLVDTVVALGNNVPALSAGRLTILWYLIPALGAASWIAFGLFGARAAATRVIAGAGALMATLTFGAFIQLVGWDRLGWGPKVALLGGIALVLGAWLPLRKNASAGL
ncbi:MAG TPA: hypothetical protein VNC41_18970 [Acidimicrobiia bacterium]|nr:hypothetical protein [Acidimicrobiia bacterium]